MTLFERINEIAQSNDTTIAEIEREVGFPKGTIGKWKQNLPSCTKLIDLADFLEVDARYLERGEPTSFDIPAKHREILNSYNRLKPEKQTLIKGMLAALEEATEQKEIEIAKKMLMNHMSVADVMTYTDLDEETIKQLHEEITK